MVNQKDQFGTTPDQPNASRTSNATNSSSASTASGASAASRKSTTTPGSADTSSNPTAQSTAATPSAQSQNAATAGSSRQGEGQQTNDQEGTLLDTALNSGKKWIEDSGVLNSVNQLPQSLKDLGNRALDRVNSLSTTQKVVGGAILAAGIGWLATRKGKSESSESSAYNYGRQRDAGSYGRKSYGYQAPDASTSRRPAVGTSGRTDSGSPYGNGSRYGSSGSYGSGNTGINSGSGRDDSGAPYGHASARTDHGSQSSSSSSSNALNSDYRSIE